MAFEVEQKFPVEDLAAVRAALVRLGVKPADTLQQVDRYYAHPSRDFAATDEALRIRTVGELNFLTYKGPKLDAATKTRREIEFPIASGEAAAAKARELLAALGFEPVAEVRKQRGVLRVHWEGCDVEVALDRVEEVGDFAELEINVGELTQIEEARKHLASLAAALGLAASERRSYLEMLLLKQSGGRATP